MGENVGVKNQSNIDVKGFFKALFGKNENENNEEAKILTKEQLNALENVKALEEKYFKVPKKAGESKGRKNKENGKYENKGVVVETIQGPKPKGIERE